MNFKNGILQEIDRKLRRVGFAVNRLQFNRSDSEINYEPERLVTIDTTQGILQICFHEILKDNKRLLVYKIVIKYLKSLNINILNKDEIDLIISYLR